MTPHPGYRVAWVALHVAVILAGIFADLWGLYYASVAALEAIALVRRWKGSDSSGTWSWVVWAFLFDEDGSTSGARIAVVAAWSLLFCVSFVVHGWFSPGLNAFVGPFFLVWLWAHFFGHRRNKRTRDKARSGRGGGDGGRSDDSFESRRGDPRE